MTTVAKKDKTIIDEFVFRLVYRLRIEHGKDVKFPASESGCINSIRTGSFSPIVQSMYFNSESNEYCNFATTHNRLYYELSYEQRLKITKHYDVVSRKLYDAGIIELPEKTPLIHRMSKISFDISASMLPSRVTSGVNRKIYDNRHKYPYGDVIIAGYISPNDVITLTTTRRDDIYIEFTNPAVLLTSESDEVVDSVIVNSPMYINFERRQIIFPPNGYERFTVCQAKVLREDFETLLFELLASLS